MHKLLLILLLFVPLTFFAQLEEARRITQRLCSPEFHGRGYVNQGDSIAAEFIAAEFQNLGLDPIKGNYFQSFTHNVNTFPGKMEVKTGDRLLQPGIDFLIDPSSPGGNKILNPILVNYELIKNEPQFIWTIKHVLKDKTHDAFVFDFSSAPKDSVKDFIKFSRDFITVSKMPVFLVTEDKFTWSVSDEVLLAPYILLKPGTWNEGESITLDINQQFKVNYTSRNVISMIKGKGCSKKTIVFTAHYDHLGRMGSDTYFPGGNDNASGTAMLLVMAKYFKEHPPKFNVLFIAFAGEEAGLLGSKYFTENPQYNLKKIDFLINLDIMGSGEEGITIVNATLFEKEFALLQEINKEKDYLTQIKSRGPAANSDHYWFTQMGVPAFFIYTMGPNKNYHDVFDTYVNLSFAEVMDITDLLVHFAEKLTSK